MPRRYEAIRDSYLAKGVSVKEAKKKAAMTFNSTRKPGEPSLNAYIKREKTGGSTRRTVRGRSR